MGDKKIHVTIDKAGKPTVEAEGFSGTACTEATASLIDKLAGRDAQLDVVEKEEMYMQADEQEYVMN